MPNVATPGNSIRGCLPTDSKSELNSLLIESERGYSKSICTSHGRPSCKWRTVFVPIMAQSLMQKDYVWTSHRPSAGPPEEVLPSGLGQNGSFLGLISCPLLSRVYQMLLMAESLRQAVLKPLWWWQSLLERDLCFASFLKASLQCSEQLGCLLGW
jgi:hypothetical protein